MATGRGTEREIRDPPPHLKKKGDFLSVLRRKIPRLNIYEFLLDSFIQLEGLGLDDQAGPFLI